VTLRLWPPCLLLLLAVACSSSGGKASTEASPTPSAHSARPVLGWSGFLDGTKTAGWGTSKPATVSNEGDDSSFVYDVHWKDWGSPDATGVGKRHAFKAAGENDRHGVLDELRATNLGACHGVLSYRTLYTRQARRPGTAKLGRWFAWTRHRGSICGRFGSLT
jgi:hypothetical protein